MQGAVAIEFALIFSLLFALFYAIVSYALPLLMLQTFNAAAADGVRAAVSVVLCDEADDDCDYNYKDEVKETAEDTADDSLEWLQPLSGNQIVAVADPNSKTCDEEDSEEEVICLTVTVTYPNYLDNPPIPVLTLPVIGAIPRLPDELASEATIRL